jgi:hypothetical protein
MGILQGKQGLWLVLAVLAAACIWFATAFGEDVHLAHADKKSVYKADEYSIEEQLKRAAGVDRLLSFAEAAMKDSFVTSLQWYGSLNAEKATYLADRLHAAYGCNTGLQQTAAQWQDACTFGGGTDAGWSGVLTVMSGQGHEEQASVRLEAVPGYADKLAEVRRQVDGWLSEAQGAGGWSVKLEGTWSEAAAENSTPERELAGLSRSLLQSEGGEVYRDGSIINATYRSELLPFEANGTDGIALQTALHKDTQSGEWRLAIGSPMLTGEF